MTDKITLSQFDELLEALYINPDKFVELMQEYTGITVMPYVAYQFFDSEDNYIGDTEHYSLSDILKNVCIEVVANG